MSFKLLEVRLKDCTEVLDFASSSSSFQTLIVLDNGGFVLWPTAQRHTDHISFRNMI